MRTFRFTNENGRSVLIGDNPYLLTDFLSTVDSRAQTAETPEQDGRVTYGVWRKYRVVVIDGYINAATDFELDKAKTSLSAAFDPKFFGDLVFSNHIGKFHLRARALSSPNLKRVNAAGTAYRFSVTLESDEPYFTEYPQRQISVGTTYFNHRFPWFLPSSGSPFSIIFADTIAENPTELNIYPTVEIMDTNGASVYITNSSTGASLRILQPVGTYQKMVVNTARRSVWLYEQSQTVWSDADSDASKPNVWADSEYWSDLSAWKPVQSVLRWLSLDSELSAFYLAPGVNRINVNEGLPTGKPITVIRYAVPAVGV